MSVRFFFSFHQEKKKHRFVFWFSFVLVLLFSILSFASINAVNPTADHVFRSLSYFQVFLFCRRSYCYKTKHEKENKLKLYLFDFVFRCPRFARIEWWFSRTTTTTTMMKKENNNNILRCANARTCFSIYTHIGILSACLAMWCLSVVSTNSDSCVEILVLGKKHGEIFSQSWGFWRSCSMGVFFLIDSRDWN